MDRTGDQILDRTRDQIHHGARERGLERTPSLLANPDEFTTDTLLCGRVVLFQPTRGFRSSLDPVLLSAFVKPPFGRFVDIGCGAGTLTFLLAARDPVSRGVGVEIQPRLAAFAAAGRERNGLNGRIDVLHADVRRVAGRAPLPGGTFDLVASNPPFRPVAAGRTSPDPERAQARHELSLTMEDLLSAASALLHPRGRFAVIYPADRLDSLLACLPSHGLEPTRVRMVVSRPDRAPSRLLLEAMPSAGAGGQPVRTEKPLTLHEAAGGYTREVRAMLGEVGVERI